MGCYGTTVYSITVRPIDIGPWIWVHTVAPKKSARPLNSKYQRKRVHLILYNDQRLSNQTPTKFVIHIKTSLRLLYGDPNLFKLC